MKRNNERKETKDRHAERMKQQRILSTMESEKPTLDATIAFKSDFMKNFCKEYSERMNGVK